MVDSLSCKRTEHWETARQDWSWSRLISNLSRGSDIQNSLKRQKVLQTYQRMNQQMDQRFDGQTICFLFFSQKHTSTEFWILISVTISKGSKCLSSDDKQKWVIFDFGRYFSFVSKLQYEWLVWLCTAKCCTIHSNLWTRLIASCAMKEQRKAQKSNCYFPCECRPAGYNYINETNWR